MVHLRGRRERPRSLCSLGYAIGFDGFIRVCWIIWGHIRGRRVRLGSLVSLGCALGVVLFVQFFWGVPFGSLDSSGVVWLIGVWSLGVAGFIGVRPWGHQVHRGRWIH